MPLPKAPKMRAIKHTMALITDSTGCTKCAPAQMPWRLRHLNPALLNRQGMSTHPKMENGSELCHWKGQLVIGLRANPVRPRKPPQIGAKLGTLRGSTTWRNVKAPTQTCLGPAWPCEKQGDQHCEYGHLKREMARPNLQIMGHCWLNGRSESLSLSLSIAPAQADPSITLLH